MKKTMDEKYNLTELEQNALTLIRRGECRFRAELSRALGISRPTASMAVEKLMAVGALCETGTGKSSRGKSPTLLSPVSSCQYTIGLDLGYSKQIVGVLLDGKNQILRRAENGFDSSSLESIRSSALQLIRVLSSSCPVTGIGIAIPGILDPEDNQVLRSINPLYMKCNLEELFSQWTALPALLENRSRSAAFSEACGGAARGQKNFMLCSLGKSIGAAFWLNGTILQGSRGAAGEIRFIRLADGRTLEEALSVESVPLYTEEQLAAICTEGLHQLMEIMDLELFILTGRFTDFSAGFLEKLTRKLALYRQCRVLFSDFGRFSAARGAAIVAAEKVLRTGGGVHGGVSTAAESR